MYKRIEQNRHRSKALRNKLKKLLAIFFCVTLLVLSVRIADMSTRRMIMSNDDKYAMAVSIEKGSLLRLDIAGERFIIDIEPAIRVTDYVASGFRRYHESLMRFINGKQENE